MKGHIFILFGVILVAGVFGGLINYLFNKGKSDENSGNGEENVVKKEETTVIKSIVTGTGASFMVPLFLNIISSDLINASRDDPYKIFVIAGYCLIAAASSTAFIGKMSKNVISGLDKLNRRVTETQDVARRSDVKSSTAVAEIQLFRGAVDPLMAKQTEPEYLEEKITLDKDAIDLTEEEIKVLKALSDCAYIYRTTEGIARETNLDKLTIESTIEMLKEKGLASRTDLLEGTRAYITQEGRKRVFLSHHTDA